MKSKNTTIYAPGTPGNSNQSESACLQFSRLNQGSSRVVMDDSGSFVIGEAINSDPICNFRRQRVWHRLFKSGPTYQASRSFLMLPESKRKSNVVLGSISLTLVATTIFNSHFSGMTDFVWGKASILAMSTGPATDKPAAAKNQVQEAAPAVGANVASTTPANVASSTNAIVTAVAGNTPLPTPLPSPYPGQNPPANLDVKYTAAAIPLPTSVGIRAPSSHSGANASSSKQSAPIEEAVTVVLDEISPEKTRAVNASASMHALAPAATKSAANWVAVTINDEHLVLRRAGNFVQVAVNKKLPTGETLLSINADRGEYLTSAGKQSIQGY